MDIQNYFALKLAGRALPDSAGAIGIQCDSELGRNCIYRIDESATILANAPNGNIKGIIDYCAKEIARMIDDHKNERNIFRHFEIVFGRAPDDESLRELPINSPCGRDCRNAIDAAKSFLNFVEYAFGREDFEAYDRCIALCEETIECYWRG